MLTASLPAAQLQSGCKEQLPMRRVNGVQDSPEHFLTYPLITGRKEDGKAEMATLGEFACSWSLKEMRPSRFCVYVRGRCLFCVFTLKVIINYLRMLILIAVLKVVMLKMVMMVTNS